MGTLSLVCKLQAASPSAVAVQLCKKAVLRRQADRSLMAAQLLKITIEAAAAAAATAAAYLLTAIAHPAWAFTCGGCT
jgi:hypothetical protein